MDIAYTIVTIAAALWVGFSAYALLTRASWVTDNLVDYGVPTAWWPWLGTAKAIGAVGLRPPPSARRNAPVIGRRRDRARQPTDQPEH